MRVVRLSVVVLDRLPILIMSKEVEEALAYMKQTFLQWYCLNLHCGFLSLGRGNRKRQARGAVPLTLLLSPSSPDLTLSLGETEKLPELVWWYSSVK